MSEQTFSHVGTRPIRHDGLDKVTGRANYGADVNLPGLLHGAILRSPHAHARIVSIDTTDAEAMPGVKAVVTGRDLPRREGKALIGSEGGLDLADMGDNLMAHDKVLYHGHAVAAVAAISHDIALAALDRIRVTYEPLTPVCTIDQAIAPGAAILHPDMVTTGKGVTPSSTPTNIASRTELRRGDAEAAFADADVVIEREFRT